MKKKLFILFLLFGSLINPGSPLVTNAEEISFIETSDVLADLKTDKNFNESAYGINKELSVEKGLHPLWLYEYNYEKLIYYFHNETGFELSSDYKYRINMSSSSSDLNAFRYDLKMLDSSDDFKFYKFEIVGSKFFDTKREERIYNITDLEINTGSGFSKGYFIPINQSYTYSGIEDTLKHSVKELEHVDLEVTADYYRTSTLNANSTFKRSVYTDINYITFPLNKNLGDLKYVNFTWSEYKTAASGYVTGLDLVLQGMGFKEFNYTDIEYYEGHDTTTPYQLTFSDLDYQEATTVSDLSGWDRFKVNLNPFNWFQDQNNDYKLPVIEKINYPYENYCLSDNTIDSLKKTYASDVLKNNQQYVLRFSYNDFCNDFEIFGDRAYRQYFLKTDILDADVLQLGFVKDGRVYFLDVSSKPNDIIKNWDTPSFFEKIKINIDKTLDTYNKLTIAIGVLLSLLILTIIVYLLYPRIKKWINKKKRKNNKK